MHTPIKEIIRSLDLIGKKQSKISKLLGEQFNYFDSELGIIEEAILDILGVPTDNTSDFPEDLNFGVQYEGVFSRDGVRNLLSDTSIPIDKRIKMLAEVKNG